ncbi:MAG: tetratricopeptide repeat protein, partial [Pseudomonadota bacterium]
IAAASLLQELARLCDWSALAEKADWLEKLGLHDQKVLPFTLLVLDDHPARNRVRSELYVSKERAHTELPPIERPALMPKRLRIGYFSADFFDHATMYLMARLLTVHDRDRFEIVAYSFGPDRGDARRRTVEGSVDLFRDVRERSDADIARMAREDRIDIAVDLKGHTAHARPGIFVNRAAPVQISFLGYPGTTGAPYIDYLVADTTVVPESARRHYSEEILYLPHSYQVNDNTRAISNRLFGRTECGLPEEGFVFCCFNACYKIGPAEFEIWMRLLARVDGSVLWLMKSNPSAEASLRKEAEARGLDGGRIVFAEFLEHADHLARLRLADLFLDTFTCNAHTTASDALWAGVPVVTKAGEGFAARVAASLLNALSLHDLITEDEAAYEALALRLAIDGAAQTELKARLAANREIAPLFDTDRFARNLEDGFKQAFQRCIDGRPPETFAVRDNGRDPTDSRMPNAGTKVESEPPQRPSLSDAVNDLVAQFSAGHFDLVVREATLLLKENPKSGALHTIIAASHAGLRNFDAAVDHYRAATAFAPQSPAAHFSLAKALIEKGALDSAAESLETVLALQPDHAEAHYAFGLVRQKQGGLDAACGHFERALGLKPDYAEAREQKLHLQARMADWSGRSADRPLVASLGTAGAVVSPFSMLAMEDAPERHRVRAERTCQALYGTIEPEPLPASPYPAERLNIGYFSADYRDHATMYLMAGLFRMHDRRHFKIHAYSYGPPVEDAMRRHVEGNVDVFRDVRSETDAAVAILAREDGLDIAVDLKGFTEGARLGIFARRAAPVQISFLGYPGTLGAPFIDYVVADPVVAPQAHLEHFSEAVISLPHCYQPNDDRRSISDRLMDRAAFGLPEDGFVFCCFNSSYKIGPDEFDIWMRLLSAVGGSVLWLLKSNRWAEANLRNEAKIRGVEPDRLVFAKRLPHDEHLARYRLADLFLDTFLYNAHTTGSDALWAGLPMVSKIGRGFAARVGASLLRATGLPDLVTESDDAYETLALELACNPERLAALRNRLERNRVGAPLFDTASFTRDLEEAFRRSHRIRAEGVSARPFRIGD